MFASRRRPARRARAGAAGAAVLGAVAALASASCARDRPGRGGRGEPSTEFLAVAGDSTYWVTSGPAGVHVRSAPLFLTRWDGRLADVYVVDDGVRFDGAEFSTVRVYRRDLLTGDSTLVAADDEVPHLAARYAAAHPDARPLDDGDDSEADPSFVAEHGVGLVAVHGPYLTLDLRTFVDGSYAEHLAARRETLRRRVVDLRTGRAASLAVLFGPTAPAALADAGRRAFARARATLDTLAVPAADDSTRERARAALATLRFDPDNFGLAIAADGGPAVQFVALGGDEDGAVTLALPPVALSEAGVQASPEPAWWTAEVRPLSPATAPDAARLLANVPGPAEQLVRLDRPPADAALRRALRRAFDQSALDDAVTTSVAFRHRP